jgi:hypothetical protein
VIAEITDITHITTKQDMAAWTRAHADVPGIPWAVIAGPGGTMIVVENGRTREMVSEVVSHEPATDVIMDAESLSM